LHKVRVRYCDQSKNGYGQMSRGQVATLDTHIISMNQLLSFVQTQDLFAWLGALTALLTAAIAVASLLPGDEPENTLQKIVDFLSKFSRK
jgi:hypothetical protein